MDRRSFALAGLLSAALLLAPIRAWAVEGYRGAVAAEHRLASEAGLAILQEGGNAVDAAVAAALAVGVVNPSSCGIGGGGFMVFFEQSSGRVYALDYRESAPAAAHRDLYLRDGTVVAGLSTEGGLAVATPGELAGLVTALRRFGSMPLGVVAREAIRLAREGFAVEGHLARAIESHREVIARHAELAKIFLHEDGSGRREGETLRQLDLARTLEEAGRDGGESFYRGRVARAIAEIVAREGGVMSAEDLAAYQPVWRQPTHGRFRGQDVYGMPPPSSGGGVITAVLNTLAADDLPQLEHNSPTYIHLIAESLKFAFADRAAVYGDPTFYPVPLARLLAPAHGRAVRRRLSAPRTHPVHYYGNSSTPDDAGTAHLSVVDAEGNAVALTTSVNTGFGSKVVVPGMGIILNNTMDDFSAQPGVPNAYGLIGSEANSIAARKRPLSSMSPTIVVENGRVSAVAGGSGGPLIITATLQVLLNALVFQHDAMAAVSAPRIHHQWAPPFLMLDEAINPLSDFPLGRIGHKIHRSKRGASVQLIRRSVDGRLDAASDPRKGGRAAAW